ncbi:MAG: hypothetical protein LH481_16240, partial [Burkholderiales bacterium]|nr:hypothetical protein [Burkholderiales bacterium]
MTKKNNKSHQSPRAADPHKAREQAKYENPLPSRELILELLSKTGVPMNMPQLATMLDIGDDEMDG